MHTWNGFRFFRALFLGAESAVVLANGIKMTARGKKTEIGYPLDSRINPSVSGEKYGTGKPRAKLYAARGDRSTGLHRTIRHAGAPGIAGAVGDLAVGNFFPGHV